MSDELLRFAKIFHHCLDGYENIGAQTVKTALGVAIERMQYKPESLDRAVAEIPKGWGFEIRSYDRGGYSVSLWQCNPDVKRNAIRRDGENLIAMISDAASEAIAYD